MSASFLVDRASYQRCLARLGDARSREEQAPAIAALRELCLYNRINALTCVYVAGHGWLGASLSVAELVGSGGMGEEVVVQAGGVRRSRNEPYRRPAQAD